MATGDILDRKRDSVFSTKKWRDRVANAVFLAVKNWGDFKVAIGRDSVDYRSIRD